MRRKSNWEPRMPRVQQPALRVIKGEMDQEHSASYEAALGKMTRRRPLRMYMLHWVFTRKRGVF